MRLTVVSGPPAAGKSTYIRERAQPGDVVIDLDRIALALTAEGTAHHDYPDHVRRVAQAARKAAVDSALTRYGDVQVWLIDTAPSSGDLEWYRAAGAEHVTIDPGEAVVMDRIAQERPADVAQVARDYYAGTLAAAVVTGGQLLRAEAAGPDDRFREGILVPWNEDGRTNLGRGYPVRPSFGQALAADAKVVGIYGHNREAAVSRIVAHQVRPAGLWGRIYVNRTALGDQLLAEIDGGARDGLSIEASDLVLDEAGGVVAGSLDFVAHVPVGAYSSARIHLAASVPPSNGVPVTLPAPAAPAPAAAPAPVLQANLTQGLPVPAPAPAAPAPAPAPAAPAPADVAAQLQTLLASLQPAPVPAAPAADPAMLQLLAGLQALQAGAHVAPAGPAPSAASLLPGAPQVPAGQGQGQTLAGLDPIREAADLAAQFHAGGGRDGTLLAALQDITASGLPLFQEHESRLGQKLWEGTADTSRPFWDLMTPDTLDSMKYYGWEWTKLPEMEAWAGDKTPINGNPVDLRQVQFEARRAAAGWDVDRKYRDFPSPEFWREFFTEQVRAYRRLTNKWAAEALVAAALDVTVAANFIGAGGANSVLPAEAADLVPATGVPAGALQIIKAVMIGNVILENTPRVEQTADYVMVNAYDWLGIADLAAIDLPAFLKLLKVNPEQFRTTTKIARGEVVMGCRGAMKARELPGAEGKGSPIRVEALDVARGGVDSAIFGYVGISRERVGGVLTVPLEAVPDAP